MVNPHKKCFWSKIWRECSYFQWLQKLFIDFCYQSYTKNDISPRLTHYRKNYVLKKKIHLSVEKYFFEKKYNYYVYRICHTYRRVMVLQMFLFTLFNTICFF